MLNEAMFSHKTGEHETPDWLFEKLNAIYSFDLDAAASSENHKCSKYYTKEDNSFSKDWNLDGQSIWLNPPYGKEIGKWLGKAYLTAQAGAKVICLLPARTDTKWFQHAAPKAEYVLFVKGRLKFKNTSSTAPFPSLILGYGNITHQAHEWKSLLDIGTLYVEAPGLVFLKNVSWCNSTAKIGTKGSNNGYFT